MIMDEEAEEDSGTRDLEHVRGDVCFDNVCFSYGDDDGSSKVWYSENLKQYIEEL